MNPRKIMVLGTGGTIAGTASNAGDHTGYRAAQLGIGELIRGVPALSDCAFEAEQVAQVDSKDMDDAVWMRLLLACDAALKRDDIAGVVVTHGTDTLEETAYLLEVVLQPSKPVVLTCAMRPATALVPDGPQNLADAFAVAGNPQARGILVVCAGVIHAGTDVQKVYAYRTDAFDSGAAGPLGFVEEGRIRWVRRPEEAASSWRVPRVDVLASLAGWPRVEIVLSHAGASGAMVDALLTGGGAEPPVRGIVAAGTGNGTLHEKLERALLRAQDRGVRVVRASRCARGHVMGGGEHGLAHAGALSAVKARVALMLDLIAEGAGNPHR